MALSMLGYTVLTAHSCRESGPVALFSKAVQTINDYLRITAIRRMLTIVDVKVGEIAGLVAFAVAFALFEGIGLSLLLPILQYAEGGQTAVLEGSGVIWQTINRLMDLLGLPLSLPVLLVLAFVPILCGKSSTTSINGTRRSWPVESVSE